MKDFCVVGSGIAGSTIASLLAKKFSVEIFDKARGPGGRSSNRRYGSNSSFDHGLQYITPRSKTFKKFYSIKNDRNLNKKIKTFLLDGKLSFLEVKVSNSKIKKLPRPTDLIKVKNIFMN